MADALVIVESPAKAKTIGKFLGSHYRVVASNGHVRDLPKSQLGVDVAQGFAPRYITLRGRGEVLERIRKEAKNASKIYLATDPDREGEAISWHLAHVLKLDEKSKCRIVFNEITATAVKNSIRNVRPIDMRLVNAQQARRVLDRLVGYEISEVLWKKVRKGLSAGRVQSVATRIICDREREIEAFEPEEYWLVTAKLAENGGKRAFEARYYGENDKKRDLRTEAQTQEVLARIAGRPFTATDVKNSEKTRRAAPPFTTSSLQQEAARKLNFTTRRTMMVAQQLYEGVEIGKRGPVGLISYIRTDSVRVAAEAQQAALAHIEACYGREYLPPKPNVYRGRSGAQDAHEAIRPTDIKNQPAELKPYLTSDQYRLYKLIYERFLASQMADARLAATAVTFDVNGCTFRANGSRVLFDGFTAVYTEGRDEAQEKEVALPAIAAGDELRQLGAESEQRFTQPPPRYTEATLVKTLEEKGIGRPSTYSPTISTIIERGYIARDKKLLLPTELGLTVNDWMCRNFPDIVDISFTAGMERQLDGVEEGEVEWTSMLSRFYGPFEKSLEAAGEREPVRLPDRVSDVPCDKCGAMMVYKLGRYGEFLACPNYPACRNTKPIVEKIGVACPKCGAELIKRRGKKGSRRAFYGCERYPECDFVSWDRPINERCPKCGSLLVQRAGRNGAYIACMNRECDFIRRGGRQEKRDE